MRFTTDYNRGLTHRQPHPKRTADYARDESPQAEIKRAIQRASFNPVQLETLPTSFNEPEVHRAIGAAKALGLADVTFQDKNEKEMRIKFL